VRGQALDALFHKDLLVRFSAVLPCRAGRSSNPFLRHPMEPSTDR
jgi:hypothetical protein